MHLRFPCGRFYSVTGRLGFKMVISLMSEKILIQNSITVTDKIGNHTNEWEDYFTCYCTVSGSSGGGQNGKEEETAGQTVDVSDLFFTVRYCKKTEAVEVNGYRIIFRGEVYNIISIDYMNFKKNCLKFRCRKVRR